MANWETTFVKIIKEICREEKIGLTSFDDWAFCLRKDNRHNFIYGYQFGLDNAAVAAILKDKSAASEMMTAAGIAHVPHWCVMSPAHPEFCSLDSGWLFLEEIFKKYHDLVLKDNQGTGGRLVFRVRNRQEMEKACHEIFSTASSLAVSPYVPIEKEYRVVVLNGQMELAFSKIRPHITGDGVSTIRELLVAAVRSASSSQLAELFGSTRETTLFGEGQNADTVLETGEELVLEWKHNLGQGASALLVTDPEITEQLRPLVMGIVELFDLHFASVDVVKTPEGFKILEINSGVMMENLARTDDTCYQLAKETYRKAIRCMLEMDV
jgi:glutathione synthase/RimK-type ligase-like ATP-grasp enzyme